MRGVEQQGAMTFSGVALSSLYPVTLGGLASRQAESGWTGDR